VSRFLFEIATPLGHLPHYSRRRSPYGGTVVTKERLKSPRARLFVALDLPESVREAVATWQQDALVDPALRPVPARSLHVTLCFIGYAPERQIEEFAAALATVPARPAPMRLEPEPVGVPRPRPRLFALDAPSEAATGLAGEVAATLVARGLHEAERRPFWSHVTVARVRRREGSVGVAKAPGPLDQAACEPFEAVRITLYRSNLSSHGAEYEVLASNDLPPA